ncbi:MAG: hypothetical protein Q8P87_00595 [bacterium]|nr:hypothetical protein [bacterium]
MERLKDRLEKPYKAVCSHLVLHPQRPNHIGREAFFVTCPTKWKRNDIESAVNSKFPPKTPYPVWETIELTPRDLPTDAIKK